MTSDLVSRATDIISIIVISIFVEMMLLALIYICIKDIKKEELKKEFRKNLTNEHDKALIMDYENTKWTLKKGNKNK